VGDDRQVEHGGGGNQGRRSGFGAGRARLARWPVGRVAMGQFPTVVGRTAKVGHTAAWARPNSLLFL
jgi:hypothetical protein